MRKRDELADPRSCLNKAADDEPLFVLRASDSLVPGTIRGWAAHVRFEHALDGVSPALEAKLADALAIADAMEAWPGAKVPD